MQDITALIGGDYKQVCQQVTNGARRSGVPGIITPPITPADARLVPSGSPDVYLHMWGIKQNKQVPIKCGRKQIFTEKDDQAVSGTMVENDRTSKAGGQTSKEKPSHSVRGANYFFPSAEFDQF